MTEPPDPPSVGSYPAAYPPAYSAPPRSPKNGLAIWALVIAIVALGLVWSVIGGIFFGIIAIIMGAVGRGRAKRGEATNGGVAAAGLWLGVLAVILSLVFIAIWTTLGLSFWNEVGGKDYISCMNNAGDDTAKQQQCADQFRENVEQKLSVTLTTEPEPAP